MAGAGDFLGTGLQRRFESDPGVRRVVAFDVHPPDALPGKTEFVHLDLTEPNTAQVLPGILESEDVDTLVHLAYLSNPTHNSAWAHELETIGTIYVLNACVAAQVAKLVVWSHTCVYGADRHNPNFLTEDHPLRGNPRSRFVSD